VRLLWPLPDAYRTVSTVFGEVLKDKDNKPYIHNAVDVECPDTTPVYACMDGYLEPEWTDWGGNVARITNGAVVSRYCHLKYGVEGDGIPVQAGEQVGIIGKSGSAWTGYHLHWEVKINGVAVNPMEYLQEGTMSKVALHFQNMTSWAGPVVAQYWQFPRWVKAMNPLVPDAFPGAYVLGRAYLRADNNAWESACVAKGTAGGAEYFNAMMPYYAERRGIVSAWEAANESDISDTTKAAKYRDFLDEWSRLMHSVGLRCCGGSIAVGNPQVKKYDGQNDVLRIIAPALARCDYWSYHGYWQRPYDPADDWWSHRYRLIVSECAAMGITLPPLIISETGADIGGGHNDGWRCQYNGDWNAYFADIKRYSGELNKDAYVVAATFFTSGPNGDWDMFEIDQVQAQAIGQFVLGDVVEPPVPVDDLLTWAETIVIPYNPQAAIFRYIIGKGWTPQSQEMSHDGAAYMWGWQPDNTRTLCGWINGQVQEVATRPN
jgi:hypothetical protein